MEVLVVLEHQPLGGVPVQRVVRGTHLDQLVELAEEIELGLALDEGEPRLDSREAELGVGTARVQAYGNTLYQVPKLGEDILREQRPLIREQVDVLADHLIRASDLLLDRAHLTLTSPLTLRSARHRKPGRTLFGTAPAILETQAVACSASVKTAS